MCQRATEHVTSVTQADHDAIQLIHLTTCIIQRVRAWAIVLLRRKLPQVFLRVYLTC
jgi:hypothetical protein